MKAMILAAGKGERLMPLTRTTPKPMLKVGSEPLIAHQLRWLRDAGFTEVVVNLHHLGEQIEAFCGGGSRFGMNVHYSREKLLLETGGGVVNALPLLGEGPFILLNGDIYTDFDFASLPAHLPAWADIHLVLTPTPDFREHGDFDYASGRITARGDGFVYCGIALLHTGLFRGMQVQPFSLQHTLFHAVAEGRASAQIWEGYWTDIGSPSQLQAVNAHLSG